LPRDVWILQAGGLANMFGNGVIGPFLIIYLHNVRGISLGIAGLVVASNSAAGLVSGFVGGALSDRVGPRRVVSGSLILMAVAFGLFPLIREPWEAFALNVLAGLGSGCFWPSQSTLLSSLTPPERRHAAFAQQRMTMNVGIALGGLVAGAIARTDRPGTFPPASRGSSAGSSAPLPAASSCRPSLVRSGSPLQPSPCSPPCTRCPSSG
jgi:MFS family permease